MLQVMTTSFHNIVFDDRDTDHFRYAGKWFLQGSYNASSTGETGTLSSTKDTTANVTFTFPTPAIAFEYWGIPRCCGGLYAICVDCDPVKPNFIPIDAVVPTDNGQNPPVVLFSKTFDKPGIHEIILTNQADPRFGGNSQITLDRFELSVPDSTPPAPTVTTIATPAASVSPVGAANKNSSSLPTNVALIAGIIGGVVLLLLAACGVYLYRRRKRRQQAAAMMETPSMEYTYAPRVSPSPMPTYNFLSSPPSMRSTSLGYSHSESSRGWHSQNPSISASSTTTNPFSSESSGTRGPRRETDAGQLVELEEDESDAQTLPPEYGQVFGRRLTSRARPLSTMTGTTGDVESTNGGGSTAPAGSDAYPIDTKPRLQ